MHQDGGAVRRRVARQVRRGGRPRHPRDGRPQHAGLPVHEEVGDEGVARLQRAEAVDDLTTMMVAV